MPTSAGGALDTASRLLQPHLEEVFGQTVVIENREGGNFVTGTQSVLNDSAAAECETVLTHAIPNIAFAPYLQQDVQYTYDDFRAVAGWMAEPRMVAVGKNSWGSMEEFIGEALARPGEISVSVSTVVGNDIVVLVELEKLTGAQFNIVAYDGGAPARNALAAGEVDATTAGLFNLLPYEEEFDFLGIVGENQWQHLSDAPNINDLFDGEPMIDIMAVYGMFVSRECAEQHPDRYQTLVDAVTTAAESPAFQGDLEELDLVDQLSVRSADDVDEHLRGNIDWIERTLEESPESFVLE